MEDNTALYSAIGFMVVSNFVTICLFWWFTIKFSWAASRWKTSIENRVVENTEDINQAFNKVRRNAADIKTLNDSWTNYWKEKAAGRHQ